MHAYIRSCTFRLVNFIVFSQRYAEDNANFSLNTDDPTITGHSLNEDYALTSTWGLNEVHVIRAVSIKFGTHLYIQ